MQYTNQKYTNSAYYFCFDNQQYYNQEEMNKLSVLWRVSDRPNPHNEIYQFMADMILGSIYTNTRYDINEKMLLDCFIKINNRSFVIHIILLVWAFNLYIYLQHT